MEGSELIDEQNRRIATLYDVSSPRELELLQPDDNQADNVVINFPGEWQVFALSHPSLLKFIAQ